MADEKTPDALEGLQSHILGILNEIGEDPTREGLRDTPKRYAKALRYLTSGYHVDVPQLVGRAIFSSASNEMVLVRDIELYSLCEHHMLPFYGRAHVAYLPKGKVIGLSKIPRIIDAFSRRLQIQENLTVQIANTLQETLKPHGVAVIIEAFHLCMMMRGVSKQNSKTVTSAMLGEFRENPQTRQELMHLLNGISL